MRIILLIFLSIITNLLDADIVVKYSKNIASEIIQTTKISGVEYFKSNELNKTLQANIKEDIIDQRLTINLYNLQFIFLIDSSYLHLNSNLYNMISPMIMKNGIYYIPAIFLEEILPLLIKNAVSYNHKNKTLLVEVPEDHSIKKIVIDPGHGGKDPGAVGFSRKVYEKNITLLIAKKLKNKLEKELGVEVLLTRSEDKFVSLQQRTKFANKCHADLFISLHCNSARSSKASGIEVYYLSTAKTNDARAVEAIENSVVYKYEGGQEAVKNYDDLSFILMDMAQSEQLEESSDLAIKLQSNLIKSVKWKNRGVKQAGFYVLKGAFMPSVLIEMGFVSNKDQEKKLNSATHQKMIIDAIFDGINSFKSKYDQIQ